MAQVTQPYRKSLSGSLGAGMKSVFGGKGRTYYMLVHKVSSKYHKAGESQPIIVDEIELGRGSQCQVRFDDSFSTVSRRHAAIVKDGDNWKLVQLSTTNSTYLNGRKVDKEWYLQNGDEIQLSTNGPKLGFIIPEGEKGKVSSIGLTARLNLFRKQALRPYKTALSVMGCVLVLVIVGATLGITDSQKKLVKANEEIADLIIKNQNDSILMDSLSAKLIENTVQLVESKKDNMVLREEMERKDKMRINQINNLRVELADTKEQMKRKIDSVSPNVIGMIKEAEKYTYYLRCDVCVNDVPMYAWTGTGFLLDDGRFVTARHCVDVLECHPDIVKIPIKQSDGTIVVVEKIDENEDNVNMVIAMNYAKTNPELVSYKFVAISPNNADKISISFKHNEQVFHKGQAEVVVDPGPYLMNVEGEAVMVSIPWSRRALHQDFAWIQTDKKGNIKANPEFSKNMPAGTKLFVLGYPVGEGKGVSPIFSESSVARSGLNDKGCIQLSNEETEGGNSGGPVFALHDGELVVVGILSGASRLGGRADTKKKDRVVPISAIGKK